jgi:hypothetical protein
MIEVSANSLPPLLDGRGQGEGDLTMKSSSFERIIPAQASTPMTKESLIEEKIDFLHYM